MTCSKCSEDRRIGECVTCKGTCGTIDPDLLRRFRACEPGCGSPDCSPPDGCDGGTCPAPGGRLSPVARLLLAAVQAGALELCECNGAKGFRPKGSVGGCVVTWEDASTCYAFGPNWNAAARASRVTPDMAVAIAGVYGNEPGGIVLPAFVYGPIVTATGTWYAAASGSLGVAHTLCLTEVSVTYAVGGGGDLSVPIIGVGITGLVEVCGEGNVSGDTSPEGFSELRGDYAAKADPSDIDNTEERCACAEICKKIAAESPEVILVQVAGPGEADPIPADAAVTVRFKATRCNWLVPYGKCIEKAGSRHPVTDIVPNMPPPRNATSIPAF